ncbi:hypothetical protein ONZ43_g6008 [Nemania bipapillata]|uniref:Uncharacterized protein n=1 Tax=Nemania bipapillata TaxID=110536 RepID=A0ACC2I3L0_9PEZI|nr:hypothetical protein ONZ43_g6008 [Nemania bipapillata]
MSKDISDRANSLETVVNSIQSDLKKQQTGPFEGLRNLLPSPLYDHIDDLGHHLSSLANAVQNSENPNELKPQVDLLSSYIEDGFQNLAQEIVSTIHGTNPDYDATRQEFERQVQLIANTNVKFLSVVTGLQASQNIKGFQREEDLGRQVEVVPQSSEPEIELKAMKEEIERLKAALEERASEKPTELAVPSSVTETKLRAKEEEIERLKAALSLSPEDAEYWKKSAEQFEESLKLQVELMNNQEAALVAKHEEQSRLFIIRYRALVEELAEAKGNIRLICRIKPEDAPEEELLKFSNPDEQLFLPWAKLRVTYQNDSRRIEQRDFEFQRTFSSSESNQDVFDEVKDFAKSAANGQTCTVMAYGATGTVFSYIRLLFQIADEERAQYKYDFYISAIEIYLNKVYDLLQAPYLAYTPLESGCHRVSRNLFCVNPFNASSS